MKNFMLTAALAALSLSSNAQWTQTASIPCGITNGCNNVVIGDTAYVTDGYAGNRLWAFNLTNGQWYAKGALGGNKMRGACFCFTVNGKLYVACGDSTAQRNMSRDMWMYDPADGIWTKKAPFPGGPRDAGFSFVLNNMVYAGGGEDGVSYWSDFWKYNPATDQWTPMADLPMDNVIFPASFVLNGKGYITCWEQTDGASIYEQKFLWEFDPAGSGQWTKKADFPGAVRQAATGFAANGFGYVGGGQTNYTTAY